MKNNNIITNIKLCMISLLISTIVAAVLACAGAYLILNEKLSISSFNIMVPIIHFVAALCGGWFLCRYGKDKLIIKITIQMLISLLLMFITTIILFSSNFKISIPAFVALLFGYFGSIVVQFKKKERGNKVRYKYKNG